MVYLQSLAVCTGTTTSTTTNTSTVVVVAVVVVTVVTVAMCRYKLASKATGYGLSYHSYEGWNFNSGNYLFTTDTK